MPRNRVKTPPPPGIAIGEAGSAPVSHGSSPRRARHTTGPTGGDPKPTLTSREAEVLRHLARGLTVREAAQQLHLRPKTVDAHKTSMMRKLCIHNRAGLTRYAIREGVVSAWDD